MLLRTIDLLLFPYPLFFYSDSIFVNFFLYYGFCTILPMLLLLAPIRLYGKLR